jgi:hypothetical protein
MTITLTPDIERVLAEEAQKLGITPGQIVLGSLQERFVPPKADTVPTKRPKTLADFLRGHIGVLHSSEYVLGRSCLSLDCGHKFTDGLDARRPQRSWRHQ